MTSSPYSAIGSRLSKIVSVCYFHFGEAFVPILSIIEARITVALFALAIVVAELALVVKTVVRI